MLKKDAKTEENGKKSEQKTLEDTCHVSSHIYTPRLLEAVKQALPRDSIVARQLRSFGLFS